MAKYHIKKDGTPGVCHATKGNCPLGGESNHYSTEAEAATVAQSKLESQYGLGATEDKTRQVELTSKLNSIDKEMTSEPFLNSQLDGGVVDGWLIEKGIINKDEGIIQVRNLDKWDQSNERFVYKPADPDLQDAANVANESTDMSEIYVRHEDDSISQLSNAQIFLMMGEIDPDGSRTRLAIHQEAQIHLKHSDAGVYDGLYNNDVKADLNDGLRKAGLIEPSDSLEMLDDNDYKEWKTQNEALENNPKRFIYSSKIPVMNELATEINSRNNHTSSVYIQHADGSRSSMSGSQFVALADDELYLNRRKANVDNSAKLFNEIKELGKR